MKVLPRVFLIVVLAVLLVGLYQITYDTKAWAALCCDNGMCWNAQCNATSTYLQLSPIDGPGMQETCISGYTFTCKDCIDIEPYSCQITPYNCYCWDNGVKYISSLYYTSACDGRR